jgi:hypothetical protein
LHFALRQAIGFFTLDVIQMQLHQRQSDQQNVLICIPTSLTAACKLAAVHSARFDLEEYHSLSASNIFATKKSVIQNSSSGHLCYDLIFEQVAHDFVNF